MCINQAGVLRRWSASRNVKEAVLVGVTMLHSSHIIEALKCKINKKTT